MCGAGGHDGVVLADAGTAVEIADSDYPAGAGLVALTCLAVWTELQ